MTVARLLLLGFVLGGIAMLLFHPRSRPYLSYGLQEDQVAETVARNPLATEPFEFFPPTAGALDEDGRYFAAFRIVRRLRSDTFTLDERDLEIVRRFIANCFSLDPDNAYWKQLEAAVNGFVEADGLTAWQEATNCARWETGETRALSLLWDEIEAADGERRAWQGVFALDQATVGPGEFIASNVGGFAYDDLQARAASLFNAAVILESSRSFASASAAIDLADMAVFGRHNPIESLGQRRYEEVKSAFPSRIEKEMGDGEAAAVRKAQQTVESWQAFYHTGAPMADAKRLQTRIESLLTASLPSGLFASSMILVMLGCLGLGISSLLGSVLNPDRRVIVAIGVVAAIVLVATTRHWLLGVWALFLTAFFCIPQMVARDAPIEWRRTERLAVAATAIAGLLLLTAYFVLNSAPAEYLAGRPVRAAGYAIGAGMAMSLLLPSLTVWARIRKVSLLRALGETLSLLGFVGGLTGLALAIIATPVAIWRDGANQAFLEQWIRNEPATFRPDAPQ